MTKEQPTLIESGTIYQIPLDHRHGKARDLFTVWFGSNLSILTMVTGALASTVFKLDFTDAVIALVIGNLVGAVFMALHAAQGAQLGVPQMVQTRGQFGSFGAVAVIAIVVVMYVGFFASNLVLGGQSLHAIAPPVSANACILFLCVLSVVGAVYGHDLIHVAARILTLLSGVALGLCCWWIVFVHGLPADFFAKGGFTMAGFLGAVSTAALWQIAYAPYVSDYSRYLPPGTGARDAFWASYGGTVLGTIFPMVLGVGLAELVTDGDPVRALTAVMGPFSIFVVLVLAGGVACGNAMNLYCGALSAITIGQTFAPRWKVRSSARALTAITLAAVSLAIATLSASNFMVSYTNFLSLLLYVLVPWTAINLVDFYLVQHGRYDVSAFFRQDGGVYGRYNIPALICYGIGVLIQVPFMSTDVYRGPIATMIKGADVAWLVGLLVVSPLYWLMVRKRALAARFVAEIA
jgi:NCS1 family nucleobase:cation symporter-1